MSDWNFRVLTGAALILLALWGTGAQADEYDYFCLFRSAAAAEVDPVVGTYWHGADWNRSVTFPGTGVITPAALLNGISTLTGFWILVSPDVDVPALDAEITTVGPCYLKLGRDAAINSQPFVLLSSISGTTETSLTFSPVPEGSAYPRPLGQ